MVGEDGGVARLDPLQRVEEQCVQPRPTAGRDGALDRLSRQLVAKDEALGGAGEQRGLVQPPQGWQVDAERRQHTVVEPVRGGGDQLQGLEVVRGHLGGAGQDGISNRGGHREIWLLGHLGDEERVAAGDRVDPFGLEVACLRAGAATASTDSGFNASLAESVQGGEVTEQRASRVPGTYLTVAIGHDQGQRHRLDTPGEEPQHVDRGGVDPVQVLDDKHGGLAERAAYTCSQIAESSRSSPRPSPSIPDSWGDPGTGRAAGACPAGRGGPCNTRAPVTSAQSASIEGGLPNPTVAGERDGAALAARWRSRREQRGGRRARPRARAAARPECSRRSAE